MASDLRLKEELPTLTDEIVETYTTVGKINHLGHCPLPKYEEVVSAVQDLRDIIYPGYRRREGLHIGNVTYHVGDLIDGLHDTLTVQIARAFQHEARVERGIEPSDDTEDYQAKGQRTAIAFLERLPSVRQLLALDVQAAFDGDPAAQDAARILRTPGFKHQKDPSDPFWVRWMGMPDFDMKYSATTMLLAFKETLAERQAQETRGTFAREFKADGDSLWEKVYNIDCADALMRLSGSGYVGGERYELRRTRGETKNIWVDGSGTSCWIDCDGRIGSSKKGGPTIYNWLAFFGHSPAECVRIIKETYPGIED